METILYLVSVVAPYIIGFLTILAVIAAISLGVALLVTGVIFVFSKPVPEPTYDSSVRAPKERLLPITLTVLIVLFLVCNIAAFIAAAS